MWDFDKELVSIEDLYENDEIVLVRTTMSCLDLTQSKYEIGIKDENGDITDFIEVKRNQPAELQNLFKDGFDLPLK